MLVLDNRKRVPLSDHGATLRWSEPSLLTSRTLGSTTSLWSSSALTDRSDGPSTHRTCGSDSDSDSPLDALDLLEDTVDKLRRSRSYPHRQSPRWKMFLDASRSTTKIARPAQKKRWTRNPWDDFNDLVGARLLRNVHINLCGHAEGAEQLREVTFNFFLQLRQIFRFYSKLEETTIGLEDDEAPSASAQKGPRQNFKEDWFTVSDVEFIQFIKDCRIFEDESTKLQAIDLMVYGLRKWIAAIQNAQNSGTRVWGQALAPKSRHHHRNPLASQLAPDAEPNSTLASQDSAPSVLPGAVKLKAAPPDAVSDVFNLQSFLLSVIRLAALKFPDRAHSLHDKVHQLVTRYILPYAQADDVHSLRNALSGLPMQLVLQTYSDRITLLFRKHAVGKDDTAPAAHKLFLNLRQFQRVLEEAGVIGPDLTVRDIKNVFMQSQNDDMGGEDLEHLLMEGVTGPTVQDDDTTMTHAEFVEALCRCAHVRAVNTRRAIVAKVAAAAAAAAAQGPLDSNPLLSSPPSRPQTSHIPLENPLEIDAAQFLEQMFGVKVVPKSAREDPRRAARSPTKEKEPEKPKIELFGSSLYKGVKVQV